MAAYVYGHEEIALRILPGVQFHRVAIRPGTPLDRCEDWARDDARPGYFYIETAGLPARWIALFTDANTAFEFKIRWG